MSISPPPTDRQRQARREATVDELWGAVHAALKARDMRAVVAFLHPLAVADPDGVELFMAVVDGLGSPEKGSDT